MMTVPGASCVGVVDDLALQARIELRVLVVVCSIGAYCGADGEL